MDKYISIPKETRHDERRVVLLPQDLPKFVDHGFGVHVETGAGEGIGYSDQDYLNAGALIVSRDQIWEQSTYIAKLLCPTDEELDQISPNTHISAFFYAGEHYHLIQKMAARNVNAYSYEYFRDESGRFPMMAADGWLSGRLAMLNAAFYLQAQYGGRGVVIGSSDNLPHCNVVVIGHGNAGDAAVQTALALGASVTVAGRSEDSIQAYASLRPEARCILTSGSEFEEAIRQADIVVGAILISTYDTPPLLTNELVRQMRTGAVIVDVTCGYGAGYLPTADKITMPGNGPYLRHGVLHLKNPRLPAMTPFSAADNASRLYAPYLLALADMIFDSDKEDLVSRNGQILRAGDIVHHHVLSDFSKIESDDYENYELANHMAEA